MAEAEARGRLRLHVATWSPLFHLPRRRCHGDRARPAGVRAEPPRHRGGDRRTDGFYRSQAAVGHGQPVQPSPLRRRRGHQPRPRGVRLRRGAGALLPGDHPPPRRRELRALGRPRRLRHPAQHRSRTRESITTPASSRWWWSTSTHRVQGTILLEPKPFEPTKHQYDRDVATVYRLPPALRPGERSEGEHRGQPRHAGRARFRARGRRGADVRHPRVARHQPRRPRSGWDTDQFPNNAQDLVSRCSN